MPPAPKKRLEPDALAASGRALALAICVALAG
ncbi:lytic transglycosylase domain-containing protein, partial [Leclercia adecarboxylata]